MTSYDRERIFKKGDVIIIGEGDSARPALITSVGGDGTTADTSTVNYSFIESDGNMGSSGYFKGEWAMKDVRKLDFVRARTVVDLPEEWQVKGRAYDVAHAKSQAESRDLRSERDPEEHPAYGSIRVTRASGHQRLFGSSFDHQHYMIVTVNRASLHRSLSTDRHHSRDELVEVHLSEAQWARFISGVGIGNGTPCTISAVGGINMADMPRRNETEEFEKDLRKEAVRTSKYLDEAIAAMAALADDKAPTKAKRQEVLAKLQTARQHMTDHMPFTVQQLAEKMEVIVQDAKIEVDAYVNNTVVEAGIAELAKTLHGSQSKVLELLPSEFKKTE